LKNVVFAGTNVKCVGLAYDEFDSRVGFLSGFFSVEFRNDLFSDLYGEKGFQITPGPQRSRSVAPPDRSIVLTVVSST
jgi:hypothetical protein